MNQINKRLEKLREVMKSNSVAAYIVPGTDPHASEYIADCWKERQWISGFNGSAGTAVITTDTAGLWTDSRYFLQGATQLEGSSYELQKQGLPETLEIIPYLAHKLKSGDTVAVNPQMFSYNAYQSMKLELALSNINLVSIDLLKDVWTERPEMPQNPFFVYSAKYAGQTTTDKLAVVRAELKKAHAETLVISSLDEVAWLFNIRSNDVEYNPLVIAYALVEQEKATLFVDAKKVTKEAALYLKNQGIDVKQYLEIYEVLAQLPADKAIFIDGSKLNESLFEAIPAGSTIRNAMSPVFKLKAVKNEIEISGIREAMAKDGVALVRFFKWLEENIDKKDLSEIKITDKLHEFRAEQEHFVGESFSTIAGYAAHGAIVHYSATPETDAKITNTNILLLDSGGQYLEGTTDITRTVAFGTPSIKQKNDFTLVLKGHIALAKAIFPAGTRGSQLDILARKALWDEHINYGHGTGHGVGHFLCVHEGPQSIRMDENPTVLQPGMVISNEPGLYRANEYGIRIENLVSVVLAEKTDFGQFLKFETLTLFPIDTQLINVDLLTKKEIKWLNDYHTQVYDKLTPNLSGDEREWLSSKCKPMAV
ncbi:MAG: aminopeptidase P family protein [Prevotellaceae bacterium]|jgi:Xaa-Pro aminopeptidase|nr:aminopeptidase P family protein [Prevotellaceae bacterium]